MEIEIAKYTPKGEAKESKSYPILKYKPVSYSGSLLLVSESEMGYSKNLEAPFFEIKKVQFVASCFTDFSEFPMLVAFYLGEYSTLYPYVLSDFPGNYHQEGEHFILIDYKSYIEICEYTGEAKLSFGEYLKEVRAGNLGLNSLLEIDEKILNRDEQTEFYKEVDKTEL